MGLVYIWNVVQSAKKYQEKVRGPNKKRSHPQEFEAISQNIASVLQFPSRSDNQAWPDAENEYNPTINFEEYIRDL